MNLLKKLSTFVKSYYFCFHYLPLKQAVKLPIIVEDATFDDMRGRVIIESRELKRGMIRLGISGVSLFYPHSGFTWQNHGGTVIFKGTCLVGAGSTFSINPEGTLVIGEDFPLICFSKYSSFVDLSVLGCN